MDLLVLIIQLIAKAFNSPPSRAPASNDPNDLVRQIQARIEAARVQNPNNPRSVGPLPSARQPVRLPSRQRPAPRLAQIPGAVKPKAGPFQGKKSKRKAPPALPALVAALPDTKKVLAPPAAPPPPAKPAAAFVDAKVLARWLKPQTLRAQFILTEVFQPPVALRESHLF